MSAGQATVPERTPIAAIHRCPLCGGRFAQEEHCSICPMTAYCHTVCCPNCGYSFVERSSLLDLSSRITAWVRRALVGRRKGASHG
ncbi:MAG: hypothetical protein V3U83_02155 [Acidobacteriota bacterium]